jgi:hypothetical protein
VSSSSRIGWRASSRAAHALRETSRAARRSTCGISRGGARSTPRAGRSPRGAAAARSSVACRPPSAPPRRRTRGSSFSRRDAQRRATSRDKRREPRELDERARASPCLAEPASARSSASPRVGRRLRVVQPRDDARAARASGACALEERVERLLHAAPMRLSAA